MIWKCYNGCAGYSCDIDRPVNVHLLCSLFFLMVPQAEFCFPVLKAESFPFVLKVSFYCNDEKSKIESKIESQS